MSTPGKTPTSLIEDGYVIDLVPWWKYLWQRFNPWRLVFPWPEKGMRWIPVASSEESTFSTTVNPVVAVLYADKSVAISAYKEMRLTTQEATHYCLLPPLP